MYCRVHYRDSQRLGPFAEAAHQTSSDSNQQFLRKCDEMIQNWSYMFKNKSSLLNGSSCFTDVKLVSLVWDHKLRLQTENQGCHQLFLRKIGQK